jgi:hypothetical protein
VISTSQVVFYGCIANNLVENHAESYQGGLLLLIWREGGMMGTAGKSRLVTVLSGGVMVVVAAVAWQGYGAYTTNKLKAATISLVAEKLKEVTGAKDIKVIAPESLPGGIFKCNYTDVDGESYDRNVLVDVSSGTPQITRGLDVIKFDHETALLKAGKKEIPLTGQGAKIKSQHPQWPNADCNKIATRQIAKGMNKEQVIAAWGKPYKVNSTDGPNGINEQWVMQKAMDSDVLYFDNGVLTTVQQTK